MTLPPTGALRVSRTAAAAESSRAHDAPPEGKRANVVIGKSAAFKRCRALLGRLAPLPMPVLVLGETGTGKEVAAQLLHNDGPRARAPLVAVNCAAIPANLAESELFGHVRGAFTGAHREHIGAFARADGGTLFLDEVAELPLLVQAKLLRVLELRVVTPVGAERERVVHARVVAATHRDLEQMVRDGEFREDLFFRLGVLTVQLPALRERQDDIPPLLEHFVGEAARLLGRRVELSPEAIEVARQHSWPGNVRGLRNAVLRAAVLADGRISASDLVPAAAAPSPQPSHVGVGSSVVIPRGDYGTMKRSMLQQVVDAEGSIRRAAQCLHVPRSTLGAWLKPARAS